MERYIVRYTRGATAPEEEKQRIRSLDNVQVLDETPRMLLVQAPPETAAALQTALPDWQVNAEQVYTAPDPHPQVEREPD
jgi:hypothetical protein